MVMNLLFVLKLLNDTPSAEASSVNDGMVNKYGGTGGKNICNRKPTPVPLCPAKIQHDLA
jgi:hypothetical protein